MLCTLLCDDRIVTTCIVTLSDFCVVGIFLEVALYLLVGLFGRASVCDAISHRDDLRSVSSLSVRRHLELFDLFCLVPARLYFC